MFSSIPVMGQRDLTIKWAVGAGKAKEPLIAKGLIVDDGGAAFGWGVEQGHVGKTEIFCKFDPHNPVAKKAVEEWHAEQSARAFKERYFALLAPGRKSQACPITGVVERDPEGTRSKPRLPEGGALV
jgi:hypothetical protein